MASNQAQSEKDQSTGSFLHVGGDVAVDFVDTEIVNRGQRIDLLASWADVAKWALECELVTVAQASELVRVPDAEQELKRVRELRAMIRRGLVSLNERGKLDDACVAALNDAMAGDESRERLGLVGDRLTLRREVSVMTASQLCAIVARAAAELFASADPRRVRPCANDACILWFHDTSKSGTRRWCSMEGCGNRAKARAHAERERNAER